MSIVESGRTLRLAPVTDDFDALCTRVRQLCGVDLTQYKRQQMERRVRTFAADRGGEGDLAVYAQRLRTDADELGRFLDRVTINVSQLWRHPEQWRQIEQLVLPDLTSTRRRIRCWSAGSSYGAEAYTLAAVARDAVGPGVTVEIAGTDLDVRMVARARDGQIPGGDADLAPAGALRRHFEPVEGGWRAKAELRRMCRFEQGDLLRMPVPRARYDLVMCRNTVIYFTDPVRDALHERLAASIAPGGWLVVGPSERVKSPADLGLESVKPFVYRKP